ncbi:MAG: hypothetical protein NVSMB44_00360 [Ktedonobacteraceae bacterium]
MYTNAKCFGERGIVMKVIFRSKDFASIEGSGFGFNNRRPMANPWQYQGRVQHRQWQGTYECEWEGSEGKGNSSRGNKPNELVWIVKGDARLFGLAAALKSRGFAVEVEQD